MSCGGWLRAHEDDFLSLLFCLSVCLFACFNFYTPDPFHLRRERQFKSRAGTSQTTSQQLDNTVNLSNQFHVIFMMRPMSLLLL